ncbi:AAA family ATPase [Phyllobacterium ifriqiyense]|uniref:AAA family ATPase n=1 Tax=Phyllobacterium ifriqiyense TaxID=314238 RepID=UPI00339A4D69
MKDFGVFNNFSGTALPEFTQFNVIYGWNYSGKTTLSRLFRCVENGALHPDYPNLTFNVFHADGNSYDQNFLNACNVRVFNEDFRKENLRWEDSEGFTPILLLGAKNIEKHEEVERKQRAHSTYIDDLKTVQNESKQLAGIISKAETEVASRIARELGIGRFDKRNLKPILDAWGNSVPEPLDDAHFTVERSKLSAEEKDPLPNLDIIANADGKEWEIAFLLLEEQLGSVGTITRFVEKPELGKWAEVGLHLHKDATHCEFCENQLLPSRLATLNNHFSESFENLKMRIKRAITTLTGYLVTIDGGAYSRRAFYNDLFEEHAHAGAILKQARDTFNASVQTLIDKLERKYNNPFEVTIWSDQVPEVEPLRSAIERFQKLIEKNNERTQYFASARAEAIETLKKHYVAEAVRKIDRLGVIAQLKSLEEKQQQISGSLAELEQEISSLQAELSDSVKGAEAINDALVRFFGKADIQIKVTGDGNFLLMRGGQQARNLSEGERTAIAFCYFVTKLSENGNKLSDTIVYIDDPISSLDAHHLMHINAFIKTTFYKFDSLAVPKHQCLAKQLFISTHNYEFFHLTVEWMSSMKKEMHSVYLVERIDNNGLIASRIIDCPDSIKRYKSEYLFLFHQLVSYVQNPNNDVQVIFNLGNMARRFIEGYLAFKFLEHQKIDNTLSKVIPDPVAAERARKFMHFYSHTFTRSGGMHLPDMSEAKEIIDIILDAVRTHDPIHYGALQAVQN